MQQVALDQLISELLELRPHLEDAGVTHLAVFGSRSRGDHRDDSDLDLLVDLDPARRLSLLDVVGIGHQVEDRLGLSAQIVLRDSAPEKFLQRTSRDQIVVF